MTDGCPSGPDSAFRIPHSALAFVALGSNLGDSVSILHRAMARLRAFSDAPLLQSSLWRSSPVACPPGSPDFVNASVGLAPRAGDTPESLLASLHALEREFGRARSLVRNAPRPLDLDLIAFGSHLCNTPELILPHPRAHLRRFVLQPLSEIAPGFVLPGQTRTIQKLLEQSGSDEALTRIV